MQKAAQLYVGEHDFRNFCKVFFFFFFFSSFYFLYFLITVDGRGKRQKFRKSGSFY